MTPVMVHTRLRACRPSPAEKEFFSLALRGGERVLPCWWHHGDAYLSSYFLSLPCIPARLSQFGLRIAQTEIRLHATHTPTLAETQPHPVPPDDGVPESHHGRLCRHPLS